VDKVGYSIEAKRTYLFSNYFSDWNQFGSVYHPLWIRYSKSIP